MQIVCPTCRKLTTWEENPDRPFCSKRCRMLDLGSWASEEYRIEGKKEENEDEEDNNE